VPLPRDLRRGARARADGQQRSADVRSRPRRGLHRGRDPGDVREHDHQRSRLGDEGRHARTERLAQGTRADRDQGHALGYGSPPTSTFFEDFDGPSPQKFGDLSDPKGHIQAQNDKWVFSALASDLGQIFFDRGQLHYLLADIGQDIMGSVMGVPKHAVQLSDTEYLHVTMEVASTSTERRYWWISLCGDEQAGKTIGADGQMLTKMLQTPFFYDDNGENPTDKNWNCLQVFPRGGWIEALPPNNKPPESEVRVMLNKAGNFPTSSVINTSPPQYGKDSLNPPSWYRTMDANGKLVDIMLDDNENVSPAGRLDFWIRRNRFVMYSNGVQKICNDFTKTPLTMAEGALNFGLVLYHSSAERTAIIDGRAHKSGSRDRTGMRYVMENEPYIDARTWDNIGYDENVQPPSDFNESVCYKK